jgi:Tfp pilus assembly protein PilO
MFDKFKNLGFKKKIFISLVIFILILGSLIYFLIIPSINEIKKIETEINNQRIDLEQRYIKGQSLRQLTENLKKIEPQISVLDEIFILQDRELEFITSLEELATRNNVEQTINLDLSQDKKESGYQTLPLQLTAQGNYLDLMNYLINLESLNYYININSISLSSSGSAKLSPIINTPEIQPVSVNVNMIIQANTYRK